MPKVAAPLLLLLSQLGTTAFAAAVPVPEDWAAGVAEGSVVVAPGASFSIGGLRIRFG